MAPKRSSGGSTADVMKRPASAAGLAALEAVKRAATVCPSDDEGSRRSSRAAAARPAAPAWQAAAPRVAALAAVPAPAGSLTTAANARAEEAERRAVAAESRAAVAAAEYKSALAALQARAEAAEARAQAASELEKQVAVLRSQLEGAQQEGQSKLEDARKQIAELKDMWNQKVNALATVEKQVSKAEGRAEVLAEQAKLAADAVERAARAEERSEVMCDLQNKLPMLIRHVTGSLATQGFMAGSVLPKTIKLEIDDRVVAAGDVLEKMKKDRSCPALTDPYGAESCPPPATAPVAAALEHPRGERLPAQRRSLSRDRPPRDARDPPSCSQTPLDTPAAPPRTRSSSRERPQGSRGRHGEPASSSEGGGSHVGASEERERASMMQRAMSGLSSIRSRQLKY